MTRKHTFFTALIFLMIMTACVIPGLPTDSAPPPAPTADTGRLETMVAETVTAAIAKTEQSHPTSTLIPTLTPKPTQTSTPEPIAIGSTLTLQENGSTIFADERAGYQITIPAGWLPVRVDEKEYYDAWTLAEAADPNIQAILLGMKELDTNTNRLLVIDTQDGHIQSNFVTEISFVWDEKEEISLDTDDDLKAIAAEVPNAPDALRFEVTSTAIMPAPNGMQFGVIEAKSAFTNTSGDVVNVYRKLIIFKVKTGSLSVIFTTVEGLKESTLPAFDAMIETIQFNQ